MRMSAFGTAILTYVVMGHPPPAVAQPTLIIEDYVATPITGRVDGKGSNELLLSRVNTLREEAGGARRLFISDLNGPLYVFDKETKTFSVYLDFNGNEGKAGIFRKLTIFQGYGNGLNGFYLDPDYTRNGKFYTVHIEDPALPGSNLPNNAGVPGLSVSGYTTTEAVKTPGPLQNEGVLIEWTDSRPSNATFEGTARELLRVQLNTRSHPMGDLIFNPTAVPGDPDWRVLYLECGDGASGESKIVEIRSNPQRLDNLEGKILRIIPDLGLHTATSTVSENGRYRIPNDNPFVSMPGARKEIWAYGFRNPHRLNWAVDRANPANNRLIANSVGMSTWETVYLVRKGGNYGYRATRGQRALQRRQHHRAAAAGRQDSGTGRRRRRPVRRWCPIYPVIQYGHGEKGGDSIGSGFRLQRQRDSGAARQVHLHRPHHRSPLVRGVQGHAGGRRWQAGNGGGDSRSESAMERSGRFARRRRQLYDSMYPVVEATYHARGGKHPRLQGPAGPDQRRPRRRALLDRCGRRAVSLQQGRWNDS